MPALLLAAPAAAQYNPSLLERSVVKVTVQASGRTYSASGFLWGTQDQVVTALHIIQPGGAIVVECAGRRQAAQLARSLRDADLALLSAPMAGCTPLGARQDQRPSFGTKLYTFGFGGGAQSAYTKTLEKGATRNETLDGILPPQAVEEIRRLGSPRLDLPIYYLEGSLVPGFSGAPVVDAENRVVGIGNGGLERGASQVSWVIPVGFLDQLLQSSEAQGPTGAPASGVLFSADVDVPDPRPLRFVNGGLQYDFVRTKTRSLGELARTSDDPDGVLGLLRQYGGVVTGDAADRIRFDVWEELNRGIILTVPAGVSLEIRSNGPTVNWLGAELRLADGRIASSLQFSEQPGVRGSSGDLRDVPASDPSYLDEVLSEHRAGCTDPGFAICQFDASALRIVDFGNGNRILKAGFVLRIDGPDPRLNSYDYLSVAVRGGVSFRASTRLSAQDPSGLLKCAENPGSPYCQDRQVATTQLAALLSVHLTTFANLASATGQRVVETQYQHNGRYDDPNTLRERFHFGPTAMFFNQRGRIWQERGVGNALRNFSEVGREGDWRVLAFGPEWVRLPIWGGQFFRSFDNGASWQTAGEIHRGQW